MSFFLFSGRECRSGAALNDRPSHFRTKVRSLLLYWILVIPVKGRYLVLALQEEGYLQDNMFSGFFSSFKQG